MHLRVPPPPGPPIQSRAAQQRRDEHSQIQFHLRPRPPVDGKQARPCQAGRPARRMHSSTRAWSTSNATPRRAPAMRAILHSTASEGIPLIVRDDASVHFPLTYAHFMACLLAYLVRTCTQNRSVLRGILSTLKQRELHFGSTISLSETGNQPTLLDTHVHMRGAPPRATTSSTRCHLSGRRPRTAHGQASRPRTLGQPKRRAAVAAAVAARE